VVLIGVAFDVPSALKIDPRSSLLAVPRLSNRLANRLASNGS
jgi:hypothetical protein